MFRIQFPGDEQTKMRLQEKFASVKEKLQRHSVRQVNNSHVLEVVLDTWLQGQQSQSIANTMRKGYVSTSQDSAHEKIFMTTKSSLQRCIEIAHDHAGLCSSQLEVHCLLRKGHVALTTLRCKNRSARHQIRWSSSPYLPNGKYLVNHRVFHGFTTSGLLPVHYTRFCEGANIGVIDWRVRDALLDRYYPLVERASEQSQLDALHEEMGHYEGEGQIEGDHPGIDIETDARHGWRKNAKDTSVVALGQRSHKVLRHEHVTKKDDSVSQRHEILGTKRIYAYFEDQAVSVHVHAHDRNMSVNKFVRESTTAVNQNDLWHGIKSLKSAMAKIGKGPKYKEGQTWHEELYDKLEPMCTHAHWAARNCGGDSQKLREGLLNAVAHFKKDHSGCSHESRCVQDPQHESSTAHITSPIAEKLLTDTVTKCTLYKNATDFNLARDTYHTESFNNTMNVFQDKRIAFGDRQYSLRSHLAILHWNHNVGRPYTSLHFSKDPKTPRRQKGKKVLTACDYSYRGKLWNDFLHTVFQ